MVLFSYWLDPFCLICWNQPGVPLLNAVEVQDGVVMVQTSPDIGVICSSDRIYMLVSLEELRRSHFLEQKKHREG